MLMCGLRLLTAELLFFLACTELHKMVRMTRILKVTWQDDEDMLQVLRLML